MTNRIETNPYIQNINQGADPNTAASVQGNYRGQKVTLKPDAQSMIADAAEELTFGASETVEKKISSRKVSTKERGRLSEAVKRAEFYLKRLPDLGSPDKLQSFAEHLKKMGQASPQQLRQFAKGQFKDPSHSYAALSYARDMSHDPEMTKALEEALKQEEERYGPEIRAGFNVTTTAKDYSEGGLGSIQELRDFYRKNILEYDGLKALHQTIRGRAPGGSYREMISFFIDALGADLRAQTPSSDPRKLKKILDDLYHLEVLANCHGQIEQIVEDMARIFGTPPQGDSLDMAAALLGFKEDKWLSTTKVENFIRGLKLPSVEAQIYFLREFKEVARALPIKAFGDNEDRGHLLQVLQEALDNAIEKEELDV